MNTFAHARRTASGALQPGIAPDADTVVSSAWLDLGREPLVFSHPDMGKRWFAFSLHSLWMPALATLGSRGGAKATSVLISGPGWQGTVPKGMRHVRSPTRHVALLGRIQANGGEADVRAANALQMRLRIAPLPSRGKAAVAASSAPAEIDPGFGLNELPRQAIEAMDTASYFTLLARLLDSAAPPAPDDAPLLARMAGIGLVPGKPFDMGALEPGVQAALKDTGARAALQIAAQRAMLFTAVNGWLLPGPLAEAPNDALTRAALAAYAWPGVQPQQWLEATARTDADGQPLSGASDYTLDFAKGQMPPADAFWSIALVTEDGSGRRSAVPNTAQRFGLGSRDKLLANADGSVTLHVQNLSPGYDRAANWLPAPKGEFVLVLRLYAPKASPPSVLPLGQGSWSVPPLRKAG